MAQRFGDLLFAGAELLRCGGVNAAECDRAASAISSRVLASRWPDFAPAPLNAAQPFTVSGELADLANAGEN